MEFCKKELFNLGFQWSYNMPSNGIKTSFSDISDAEIYNDEYLNEMLDSIQTDSLNPLFWNNIGTYYQNNDKLRLAEKHFRKALETLSPSYLENDSARFYSLRGTLKQNLNKSGAMEDMEMALRLNPTEQLALLFYPIQLISQGEYEKAINVCQQALEKESFSEPGLAYIFFITAHLFDDLMQLQMKSSTGEISKEQLRAKDFNELFDFTEIEDQYRRRRKIPEVYNARQMADLFALCAKFAFFEVDENSKILFAYTNKDKERIGEIINWLDQAKKDQTLNPYTLNKNLGSAFLLMENWEESIRYFNQAIEVFPAEKRSKQFNSEQAYNGIMAASFLNNDTLLFGNTVKRKLIDMPLGRKTANDYQLLAFYHFQNNDLVEAQAAIKNGLELDPENSKLYRLRGHIHYLDGLYSMAMFYGKKAGEFAQSDAENINLLLQFSAYQILDMNFAVAEKNIEIVKQANTSDYTLSLCETLESYLP